ncbi:hypothetical protein EDB80DRAFT_30314 [Ilyonectria destructans]|nr:hypothetical protein EDB80DRAFT_30314 [Ilyonectria destructans]
MFDNQATDCLSASCCLCLLSLSLSLMCRCSRPSTSSALLYVPTPYLVTLPPQPGLLVPSPAPARPSPSVQAHPSSPSSIQTRHDQADQARHQASALIVPAARSLSLSRSPAVACPHSFALGPFLPFSCPALCFLASPRQPVCTPSLTTTLTPSNLHR